MSLRATLALCLTLLAAPLAASESIVSGLSQNRVAITANFDGSEILVFGAVARDAPAPKGRLDVIVTVEGPPAPVTVWRKSRQMGIWVNTDAVQVGEAPAFYAIATTAPLRDILTESDDLRYRISINRAIRSVSVADQNFDQDDFVEALIRIRRGSDAYHVDNNAVTLDRDTLIRADVRLPANLTEGNFRARIFLLREGRVIAHQETAIEVHKAGIERVLHRLALDRPLIYGILSLVLAIVAGWMASAAFQWFRR